MIPSISNVNASSLTIVVLMSLAALSRAYALNSGQQQIDWTSEPTKQLLPSLETSPDAPKLYDLNSLLYKTQASSERRSHDGSSLMPLDGMRVRPLNRNANGAPSSADDEEPAIETLIRDMRRRNNFDGTVQTKSSEIEAADELQGPSARILSPSSRRLSQAEPRKRKRRASPRQAPPKLKARRVSNSRGGYRIRKANRPRRRS